LLISFFAAIDCLKYYAIVEPHESLLEILAESAIGKTN
tara:strand:- start:3030 stop:3143 length:114 start_codon:yes stop_codon:yes gene_type:complete